MDQPGLWDSPPIMGITDPRSLDEQFRIWRLSDEGFEIIEAIRLRNAALRARGFQHYSINALAEVVRWHFHLEHGPDAAFYKVNSNRLSRLSRWLMEQYPEEFPIKCRGCNRKGHDTAPMPYFETRELRS